MVMALEIVRIPALTDNYIWMLHEPESGDTVVVDPALADPVIAKAQARGWRIGQIWNTHWHPDHTGGNAALKAATGCTITGPAAEAARIPTLDILIGEGDCVRIGNIEAEAIETPGHTAGHIVFHLASERILFTGDTLFAMGCGRLFEGTPAQMFANMQRLARLPGDTIIYCGHEYTVSNGRFAVSAEHGNAEISARLAEAEAMRARGEATVPTSITAEQATNPFMRASSAEQLASLRAAKDSFAG